MSFEDVKQQVEQLKVALKDTKDVIRFLDLAGLKTPDGSLSLRPQINSLVVKQHCQIEFYRGFPDNLENMNMIYKGPAENQDRKVDILFEVLNLPPEKITESHIDRMLTQTKGLWPKDSKGNFLDNPLTDLQKTVAKAQKENKNGPILTAKHTWVRGLTRADKAKAAAQMTEEKGISRARKRGSIAG